ncbi:gastrula zinc finger protein XlCGF57.1-like isoform X2 [Thalassophryne amazonica]|uniref:gastrula zinc finger protein XlCGF57.1-like isoform X2 n=1 Tax=Thalassophryne amazonica TaxID=390379 RepID=UPI0014719AE1|nr:gastrula zinc finger protein XlCGF57.1-like isoform X2 [Thalassophryne amazonica]
MQQLLVNKEDILSEWQEGNQSLDQKNSEPTNIKEELWIEDEEKSQSSQLHQSQEDESAEVELLSRNLNRHRTLKTEAHEDDCGGSQPASSSNLQPHGDDVQQLVIKEEILSVPQEWDLSGDQEDIKEEEENLWISQQGQQLHHLEETDVSKLTFTAVPVKSENDKKPQPSQVHQSQSDETTEAAPVASSSTVHRTLRAQTDGEDSGGPQPANNLSPNSPFQPDTIGGSSDSSENETDNSCEWKQTRGLSSGFNLQTNSNDSVCKSKCNITKKDFKFCQGRKAYGHMHDAKQSTGMQVSEKPFSCPDCSKRFGLKGHLNTHIRIHTGEKPFGCSECGKTFGQKGNLIRHMRFHTGQKPFGCSECDKSFGQKGDLITHMRIHSGEKPFGCSECGKTFGQKGNLITHMRIHSGEKPFSCSECGQRFGHKSDVNTHMRIHTGQKPFACSECDKRFGHKSHLITHMRIHTGQKPFACCECGKRFGQNGDLITHMRIHTGQKPFACCKCDKRFGQKANLITHMRIHTGEKPFGCSECGKRFGLKGNLITHMRIHAVSMSQHQSHPAEK